MPEYIRKRALKHGEARYDVRLPTVDRVTGKRSTNSASFRTERDALRWRNEQLASPEEKAARLTVKSFLVDEWLPYYQATFRASSYRTRASQVSTHLVPLFGPVMLGKLSAGGIERAFAERRTAGHITAAQARRVLTCLVAALNQAVAWDMLARNPAQGVRIAGGERKPERRIWSLEQYRAFMAGQTEPWSILWSLMSGTGMRIGEALALTWADVAWEPRCVIVIRRTVARGVKGVGSYEDAPKSAAGLRPIVIGADLTGLLARWRVRQAEGAATRRMSAPAYIVSRLDGSRIPYASAEYRWKAEVAKSGLPPLTMHGLRHMNVTTQIVAGVPLKVISARIGHSSVGLTANLYGHVLDEHQEHAASVVDVFAVPADMAHNAS